MQRDADPVDELSQRPRVAVVCRPGERAGAMARLLRRMVGQVEFTDRILDIAESNYTVVVVQYDRMTVSDQRALVDKFTHPEAPPLVILSSELNHEDLAGLFGTQVLTNLVCTGDTGPDLSDLLVTLQKLGQRDIFGLEKYFPWGVELHTRSIRSCIQRDDAVIEVKQYAEQRDVPRRLTNMIRTVADEFLSNALYNAPTFPDGRPRFRHRARTEPVVLDPDEAVIVQFCCDGRRFGLSAVDPFGSLSPITVMDNLARAFRAGHDQMRDEGGAGLGFFQMYDALSHLVVNIDPGRRTELIGLTDVSGGYRSFVASGTSFNIFVTEGQP